MSGSKEFLLTTEIRIGHVRRNLPLGLFGAEYSSGRE